jgi:hypothetical protein
MAAQGLVRATRDLDFFVSAPLPRLDPDNLRLAFGLSAAATAFRPARRTPGIRKFRSWNDLLTARSEALQVPPPPSTTPAR